MCPSPLEPLIWNTNQSEYFYILSRETWIHRCTFIYVSGLFITHIVYSKWRLVPSTLYYSIKKICPITFLLHSAAFLCYFLVKNCVLRYSKHLFGSSLIKYNITLRVFEFWHIFFYFTFYISKVSVSWTSTQNYQCSLKSWFCVSWM